jgi:predicted dienelactone hydrolase
VAWLRRTIRLIAVAAALGFVAIVFLLAVLKIETGSPVELPVPTGSFAVGRAIYDWRDDTHVDVLAPEPGTKREVLAWVWYPAAASPPDSTPDDYIPAQMRAAIAPAGFPFGFVYRNPSKVRAHAVRSPTIHSGRPHPVVVLRGGASKEVVDYSTLAEDLASHGYVVVGIDAPYRTGRLVFPDGRTVRRTPQNDVEEYSGEEQVRVANRLLTGWVSDIGFVLDRLAQLNASDAAGPFAGRLDMTRVGVFGHSFGGAQAAQFCHDDGRCKAAVDIDGRPFGTVVQEGMPKPFMFLMTGQADFSAARAATVDPETREVAASIFSIYGRLPPATRSLITMRGANHFTFSDDGAVLSSDILRRALYTIGLLKMDGRRQLEMTAYCLRTFFDAYLGEPQPSRLSLDTTRYPELKPFE